MEVFSSVFVTYIRVKWLLEQDWAWFCPWGIDWIVPPVPLNYKHYYKPTTLNRAKASRYSSFEHWAGYV